MLPDSLGSYKSAAGRFSAEGFGSFGETGPYTDLRTGAPVVLKLLALGEKARELPPEVKADPAFPQFSPDRDPKSGRHFYITNFLRARPLGGGSYGERREAAIDAARALARLPLPHGGLTARDLVRKEEGGVLVLDTGFGFDPESFAAERLGGERRSFLAPELLRALESKQPATLTPRCDVYSFGLILYQLFAGSLPPSFGGSGWSLGRADLDSLAAPRGLGNLLLSCCQHDPAKRPARVGDLVGPLSRLPRTYTPRPPGPGLGARLKKRVLQLVVLLLLLAVGAFFANRHGLDRRVAPALADRVDRFLIDLGLKSEVAWAEGNPDALRTSLPLVLRGSGLDALDFSADGKPLGVTASATELSLGTVEVSGDSWALAGVHRLDGRRLALTLPVRQPPRLDPLHRPAEEEQPLSKHGAVFEVQLEHCHAEPELLRAVGRVEQPLVATTSGDGTTRLYRVEIPPRAPEAASGFELLARVDGQESNRLRCLYVQPAPVVRAVDARDGDLVIFGENLRDERDHVQVAVSMLEGEERLEVGRVDATGGEVTVDGLMLAGRGEVVVTVGALSSAPFIFDLQAKRAAILRVAPLPAGGGAVRVEGLYLLPGDAPAALWATGGTPAELPVSWGEGAVATVTFPPGQGEGQLSLVTAFGTTAPFPVRYLEPQGLHDLRWRPEVAVPGQRLELLGCPDLHRLVSAGEELAFEATVDGYAFTVPTRHPGEDAFALELVGPWGSAEQKLPLAFDPLLAEVLAFETAVKTGASVTPTDGPGWRAGWKEFQQAYLDFARERSERATGSALIRGEIVARLAALARDESLPRALRAEAGYVAGFCAREGWGEAGALPEVAALYDVLAGQQLPDAERSFVTTRLELLRRP